MKSKHGKKHAANSGACLHMKQWQAVRDAIQQTSMKYPMMKTRTKKGKKTMNEICNDNRFDLVAYFKQKLIEATNIETSPDEMKCIDNILCRMWQMGWLEKLLEAGE